MDGLEFWGVNTIKEKWKQGRFLASSFVFISIENGEGANTIRFKVRIFGKDCGFLARFGEE